MPLLVALLTAVKALRRNVMRTALTALGMIIGVAAVIVMVAIGTGARTSIENQIKSAGSNIVMVNAGAGFGPVRGGQGATTTLRPEDARAIRAEVPGVRYMSPGLNARTQVVARDGNWNTQVQGASEELPSIRSWPMQYGSFFTAQDVERAAKVAVLGSVARDQLFGAGVDPTGATVRIKNQPFKVIGVLAAKGQAASIYLFMTYLGSSVVGTSGGFAWVWLGWPGVIALVGGLLAIAMLLSAQLARIPS